MTNWLTSWADGHDQTDTRTLWSSRDATTARLAVNPTLSILPLRSRSSSSGPDARQTRQVPSSELVATSRPFELNTIVSMPAV